MLKTLATGKVHGPPWRTTHAPYRLARLPRFIRVVEVIQRQLRQAGARCVLGEVVLDSTS